MTVKGCEGNAKKFGETAQNTTLRPSRWDRKLIASLLIAMVVMMTILSIPLLTHRVPVSDDLGTFFLPIRAFYAQCLAKGDCFDWMPQLFGGFFMSGEGQNGTYHPLHWLLYRWLPVDVAFESEILLAFLLLASGLIVFLRRYLNFAGACMGAMLFVFSAIFTHNIINPPILMTLAQLPWILTAMCLVVERRDLRTQGLASLAIAMLTVSQLLLGHPQSTWFAIFTEILFAAFLLIQHRPSRNAWIFLLAAPCLAVCLAAVQLLPTYSTLVNSSRAAPDLAFKTSYSMPPHAVLGAIAPYLFWNRMPTWLGYYFGSVPLMLALWWITAHRVRSRRIGDSSDATMIEEESSDGWKKAGRLSLFAAVLAALALWLAFGSYGKLYYLQTIMPLIGGFRAPARYVNLTQLGLAIIAAVAFARLLFFVRARQKISWRHLMLPWIAVTASIVLAGWFAIQTGGQSSHRFQTEFYSGPLMLGAAAVALTMAARGRRLGLYLLVFVAAADSILFGLAKPVWPKACWWKTPTYQQYASASFATLDPNAGRLYDNVFGMNRSLFSGYRLMSGYAALRPARQLDYDHVNSLRVAEVAWYRHFVNMKTPMKCLPGLAAPIKGGWCKVPNPLPRARLLAHVSVSQNPREDIKRIDIDATALVTHAIALPPSEPGTATLTSDHPGRIVVETVAPKRQLLTVSESYYPGWKVFVDDRPTPIERVNGDFMGCVVPEGRHCTRFEFAPACLRVGKTISLASLALTVLLTGVVLIRRRPST